jgi:YHS domain-containing protein
MLRLLAYLFDLVVVVIIGRLLSWIFQTAFGTTPQSQPTRPGSTAGRGSSEPTPKGQTARDPVCGMFVSTELSHKLNEGGQTLHFCSQECLERYQKKPVGA